MADDIIIPDATFGMVAGTVLGTTGLRSLLGRRIIGAIGATRELPWWLRARWAIRTIHTQPVAIGLTGTIRPTAITGTGDAGVRGFLTANG